MGAGTDFFFEFTLHGGLRAGIFLVHESGNNFVLPRVAASYHCTNAELFDKDEFATFRIIGQRSNDSATRPAEAFALN